MFKLITIATLSFSNSNILVPGLGGSVLRNVHTKQKLWPPGIRWLLNKEKWQQQIRVDYNVSSDTVNFSPFVQPQSLGSQGSIDIVSKLTSGWSGSKYYNELLETIPNLYPLPYDFRLIGYEPYTTHYLTSVKTFLETQGKVNLICHSLGGLLMHYFLTSFVDSNWREKHIRKVIYVNVPWEGSLNTIENMILQKWNFSFKCGYRLDFLSNYAGFLWCLPLIESEPFLYVNEQEVSNFVDILPEKDKINAILKKHLFLKRLSAKLTLPDVEQYVVYSTGIETISKIFLSGSSTKTEVSDGDGIVPVSSIRVPQQWKTNTVFIKQNGEHSKILSDKEFLKTINAILDGKISFQQ